MPAPAPLHKISVLAAVARLGSFSKAARELGISTSAVSQSVRSLELHVGVPLLVRGRAQIRTTDAGQQLVSRAAAALRELEAALDEASSAATRLSGTLRFTAPRVALDPVVRPTLSELFRAQPTLKVEVVVEDRLSNLVEDDLDFGIRLDEVVPKDFIAVRLSPPFRLVVAGSPAYLRGRGKPRHPRELRAHDCLGFRFPSSGVVYAWELERGRKTYRITPQSRLVTNDSLLQIDLARDGHGLICSLESNVRPFIERGELEIVLEAWAPLLSGFFACFPKEARKSPKVRAFLEAARKR